MFRFRKPHKTPVAVKPWHAHAHRCADVATRHALLAAAAAAKASADALTWAATQQPALPLPPKPEPLPSPAVAKPSRWRSRPVAVGLVGVILFGYLVGSGLHPVASLVVLALIALGVFAAERVSRAAWQLARRPAPPAPAARMTPIPVVVVSPPPPVMAARPARPVARCGHTSSKVLPILAGALVVGIVVAVSGVKQGEGRRVSAPPETRNMARLSPDRLTEYATENGVVGGARAAMKSLEASAKVELTQPPVPPTAPFLPIQPIPTPDTVRPSSPVKAVRTAFHLDVDPAAGGKPKMAVKLTGVRSAAPQTNRETALNDALLVAQAKLADQFAKLDPPLDATPSVGQIRADYLRPDSVTEVQPTAEDREAWERAGLDPKRLWVTADVEVSEDQVRQLRGERRLMSVAPLFPFVLALVGGMYGFLRLDTATKGHLTGVLLLGYGLVMAAAVALAALTGPW